MVVGGVKCSEAGRPRRRRRSGSRHGFTLTELLIVVVILGILAAATTVLYRGVVDAVGDVTLQANQRLLATQVEAYRLDHRGQYPSLDSFSDQLTMATNEEGETAPPGTPGFPYGPYLDEIPANPVTGGNSVGDGAPGTSDWYFSPDTGQIDSVRTDASQIEASQAKMSTIMAAIFAYAADHNQSAPASLSALVGDYLSTDGYQQLLTSPHTGEVYRYRSPGAPLDELDEPSTTLMLHETVGGKLTDGSIRGNPGP